MAGGILADLTVLVVEDEYFIADELRRGLEDAGAAVLGPAGTLDDTDALLDGGESVGFALLDANLNGESSFPIADRLIERQIPFIFVTGYGDSSISARFSHVTRLEKPVDMPRIIDAIRGG